MQKFVMPYFSNHTCTQALCRSFRWMVLVSPNIQQSAFRSTCAVTQLHQKFPHSQATQILPLPQTHPSPFQANESGPQPVTIFFIINIITPVYFYVFSVVSSLQVSSTDFAHISDLSHTRYMPHSHSPQLPVSKNPPTVNIPSLIWDINFETHT
jgi:hypothetical protein